MNIKEFANTHDQQPGTVATYIKRHQKLFDNHIEKIGNNINLDDEAVRLLELQYPLPKPIQIVENTETQKKYINSLEQINYLQNQLLSLQKQLQDFCAIKLLLEKQQDDFEILKKKYNELKNRNLWDRILNKD